MTSTHESTTSEMTESYKTELQTLKLKITELETNISHMEEENEGHKQHKSRIQNNLDDLQNEHDA
jgi:predicted  nucleic acid-binding Zn-ribbon protein